jgi:putative oxidoreductase
VNHGLDIGTLLLRIILGITMLAHGYNHAFGGGKLAGTARWFESIGIRPGRVHALFATLTEHGVGP